MPAIIKEGSLVNSFANVMASSSLRHPQRPPLTPNSIRTFMVKSNDEKWQPAVLHESHYQHNNKYWLDLIALVPQVIEYCFYPRLD